MAVVLYTELAPEVLGTAPGVPLMTISRAVRNAARELCEEAKCYRFTIENEPVQANEPEIEFILPNDTQLVAPINLSLDGRQLTPTSTAILDADDYDWRTRIGTPEQYYRSTDYPDSVLLVPLPQEAYTTNGVRGVVAIKPTRASTSIDEYFLDRYQTTLVSGALRFLLMMSGMPWYNPQQAAYHGALFETQIDKARSYASGDDMPKRKTVRYGGL